MTATLSKLPNGFRVATDRMEGLASVALGVWVLAGGRNETEQETGLSHFLEHMAFKGTARRSAFNIVAEIESVGGTLNAYTSYEATAYHARVLAEDTPLAVDILADILRAPVLAKDDVEVERTVILQEIGQSLDSPDEVVHDRLLERAYPDQPLGRNLLGPAELVSGFSADNLRTYLDALYRPESMLLIAAGAVEHDALVAQAEALFGDLEPSRPIRAASPAQYCGGEFREEKDLEQAHLAFALEAPDYRDPDRHAARIFAAMLGGGMSSRLFQEARERRGLCYGIYAQYASFADSGLLAIHTGTGEESAGELAELAIDETRRLADSASEEETRRVRAQIRAGLLMALESPMARCERMASSIAIWQRPVEIEETLAEVDAVDAARARAAGQRMLAQSTLSCAYYGKIGGAPGVADLNRRLTA